MSRIDIKKDSFPQGAIIKSDSEMRVSPLGEERALEFGSIVTQLNFLKGKVLTIIDASYSNERQLKAVKDLIHSQFSEQISWISDICYPQTKFVSEDEMRAQGEDPEEIMENAVTYNPEEVEVGE